VDYLVLAVIAGLAAVERKGFLQAMLARPVTLAPIAGLALGDLPGGLLLGPPLELLWLGAVSLGAALPPNEALGAVTIAGGAVLAGRALGTGVTPEVAAICIATVGVLTVLGRRTDIWVEDWNVRFSARAETLAAAGSPRQAVRENLLGMLLPFAISFVLAPVGAVLCAAVAPALLRHRPGSAVPLAVGFAALCGLAAAVGARSFRSRRGVALFLLGAVPTVLVGRWLGVGGAG
jgi:PTS system mannose-specific IIC component